MASAAGFVVRKLGVVLSHAPEGAGSSPEKAPDLASTDAAPGQMLRLLDALVARFAIPVESTTLGPDSSPALVRELDVAWLGAHVPPGAWLRQLSPPVSLLAPFPAAGRSGLLVWAMEESGSFTTAARTRDEHWVDTYSLSRAAVEASVRRALTVARERGGPPPIWAYAGWGESEEGAMGVAAELSESVIRAVPLERIQQEIAAPDFTGAGPVILAHPRTALPLARQLGAQGWIAAGDTRGLLAQSTAPLASALVLAQVLDQLGLARESAALEKATREAAGDPAQERTTDSVVQESTAQAGGSLPGSSLIQAIVARLAGVS